MKVRGNAWKHELGAADFKIGIAWQGDPAHAKDRWRSIALCHFSGLRRIPGVQLYSLQIGVGGEQLSERAEGSAVVDLGDRIRDFQDTAAIMCGLDLVISCDSPAHLAGALGVPVWLALPFALVALAARPRGQSLVSHDAAVSPRPARRLD